MNACLGSSGTHCYLLEWLLPGVGTDVVVKCRGSSESAAAIATLEGPVTGMCYHMVAQL